MATITLATLMSITFYITNSEVVNCNGDCTCSRQEQSTRELCTLNCATPDSCKSSTLTCGAGRPCTIMCTDNSACADGVYINAVTATDVFVACNGNDACKTNLILSCGTGDCHLQCGPGPECEDFGMVETSRSSSFTCVNCPDTVKNLQFTPDPTKEPTQYPSLSPTKNPTITPTTVTNDPTISPTNTPTTAFPTHIPTISPSSDPTTHPTTYPSNDPTNDPTFDPTTNTPTNFPTISSINPTQNPSLSPIISTIETVDINTNMFYTKKEDKISNGLLFLSLSLAFFVIAIVVMIGVVAWWWCRNKKSGVRMVKSIELMEVVQEGPSHDSHVVRSGDGGDSTNKSYLVRVHYDGKQFDFTLNGSDSGETYDYGWSESIYDELMSQIRKTFNIKENNIGLHEIVDDCMIDIDDMDDIVASFDCCVYDRNKRSIDLFVKIENDLHFGFNNVKDTDTILDGEALYDSDNNVVLMSQ